MTEVLQLLIADLTVLLGRVRVASTEDPKLKVLAEIEPGAEEARVGEVEKSEVLGQIILRVATASQSKIASRLAPI